MYIVKAAFYLMGLALNPTTETCVTDLISSDDLHTIFLLNRSSNMCQFSNIVSMQKMGLSYETYMSRLGIIFDMYDNVDAFPYRCKKQKIRKSTKVPPLTTNHTVLKAMFHGHERKRKNGWVPAAPNIISLFYQGP